MAAVLGGAVACALAASAYDGYDDGIEALTRGPIHEAFAHPVSPDDGDRYIVPQRPPDPIDELPPDVKPAGDNIVWISGYWLYDDDFGDFVWISGCWRAVPPGRSWIPGYWRETASGHEWIAGFWKDADTRKIVYLPQPPETLEQAPPSAVAYEDRVWVEGTWVWQPATLFRSGRYAWRPGFWLQARPDWIWVPAHYVLTPHGYVFVDGYWDYTLERRGTVFLPVRFPQRTYVQTRIRFSPSLVIEIGFLTRDLFCSPRRHHYFFGDYHAVQYVTAGYHPWFEQSGRKRSYDHIFVHEQWRHRDDHAWAQKQKSDYERRRDHSEERPPRTYREMEARAAQRPEPERKDVRAARPLKDVVQAKESRVTFEKLDPQRREEAASRGGKLGTYREERSRWETPAKQPEPTPTRKPEATPARKPEATQTRQPEPTPARQPEATPARQPEAAGRQSQAAPASREKPHTVRPPESPVVSGPRRAGGAAAPPATPAMPKANPKPNPREPREPDGGRRGRR